MEKKSKERSNNWEAVKNSRLKIILFILLWGLVWWTINFIFIAVNIIVIKIFFISFVICTLWFLVIVWVTRTVLKDKWSFVWNILASIIVISLFYVEIPISLTVFFILLIWSWNLLWYKKFKYSLLFGIGASICILIATILIGLNLTSLEQEWGTQWQKNQGGVNQGRVTFGKPIIYLYPTEKTDIKVNLSLEWKIIADLPKYDEKIHGWDITAFPDGKVINSEDGKEYSYLFWEGLSDTPINWNLSSGFVVAGKDSREFLQDILPKLGLTPKEYNEFIVYWYPVLQKNPYNLIHFAWKEYTDSAKLTITPTPDSLLRVFMVYKPLQEKIDIPEQKLPTFERKGFSVVEWGGTEISDSQNTMK